MTRAHVESFVDNMDERARRVIENPSAATNEEIITTFMYNPQGNIAHAIRNFMRVQDVATSWLNATMQLFVRSNVPVESS